MTINGYRFIYADQDSDMYGVILCSIGTPTLETNDEESNIITSTTPFRDTWDLHGIEKSAPLQFKITIAKQNGEYINADEQRRLKRWLCTPKRQWLQVDQDDLSNIFYNCIIINPRPVDVGMLNAGLEFTVICDSTHAWSDVKKKVVQSSETITFSINNIVDFEEYIVYPTITITPTLDGNISIKNNTTNTTINIDNCITTEVITLDCNSDKIKSSNGRIMLDSWNKQLLGLIDGINNITVTGSCTMKTEYRLPIRVGG